MLILNANEWVNDFIESADVYRLQFTVQDIWLSGLLVRLLFRFTSSLHLLCCIITFLTFSILELTLATLYSLSVHRRVSSPNFPISHCTFKEWPIFCYMSLILAETIILIPISGFTLVNFFQKVHPSNSGSFTLWFHPSSFLHTEHIS
jgi:hypothetical protein